MYEVQSYQVELASALQKANAQIKHVPSVWIAPGISYSELWRQTIYFHGLLDIALHGTVWLPLWYPQQIGNILQRFLPNAAM